MAEEVQKLRFAGEFPGVIGTDTAVWFYDHRVSDFPDEVLCRCKVRDQMVTCTGNTGFFVAGGSNMKIFPKSCILGQPVFVVALQVIDLSMVEG